MIRRLRWVRCGLKDRLFGGSTFSARHSRMRVPVECHSRNREVHSPPTACGGPETPYLPLPHRKTKHGSVPFVASHRLECS